MKPLRIQRKACLFVVSLTIVCVCTAEIQDNKSTSTFGFQNHTSSSISPGPWNLMDIIRNVTGNHATGNSNSTKEHPRPNDFTTLVWNANDTDGEPRVTAYNLAAESTRMVASHTNSSNVTSLHRLNTTNSALKIKANSTGNVTLLHSTPFATTPVLQTTTGIPFVNQNVTNVTFEDNIKKTSIESTLPPPTSQQNHSTTVTFSDSTYTGMVEPKLFLNTTSQTKIVELDETTKETESTTLNKNWTGSTLPFATNATSSESFFWNAYNLLFHSSSNQTTDDIENKSSKDVATTSMNPNNRTTRSTTGMHAELFGSTHPSSAATISEKVEPLHNLHAVKAFNAPSTSDNVATNAPTSPSWSSAAHPFTKKKNSASGTSREFSSNLGRPWDQQSESHGQNHFNSIVNVNVDSTAESLEKFNRLEAMITQKMDRMEKMAGVLVSDLKSRISQLEVVLHGFKNQRATKDIQELKQHLEALINAKSQSLEAGFKNVKCTQNADLTSKISATEPTAHQTLNVQDETIDFRELRRSTTESPNLDTTTTSSSTDGVAEWRAKRTKLIERWENNFQRGLHLRRKSVKRSIRNKS